MICNIVAATSGGCNLDVHGGTDWKIIVKGKAYYVNHHTKVMTQKLPECLVSDYRTDDRFPLPMLQRAAIFLQRRELPVVNVTAFSSVRCK